jgi:nucleoside-diphosphate-sugar epimerase
VVSAESELTVVVTGPTGTFGFGLIPLLQAEDRVARIVGIARRPFDPAAYGWTKLEYRRSDVRNEAALLDAFAGADVVVHLAFLVSRIRRSPVPLPALVPPVPLQFVHEDDLGQALLRCVLGAGPPGAYNIAADGILSTADVAREFGLFPLPLPSGPARLAARAVAALPFLPPAAQWVEAASHPAIMDTAKAKQDLGWTPRFTALEALRDTLRPRPGGR